MTNHWTTRMRLLLLTLGISLIFPAPLRAQEANWRIGPLHSGAHFSVRHMIISTVRGEFTGVTESVTYDSNDPTRDAVEATIDCPTVNTGVAKRDTQLKGADFFDIAHYPTIEVQVQASGEGG